MRRAFRLIFVLLCTTMISGVPRALAEQVPTPAALPAPPVASLAHGSLLAAMDPSVPPGKDFFCFEPVDHPINAHNLPGGAQANGLTVLAPGQDLRRTVRFAVEEIA